MRTTTAAVLVSAVLVSCSSSPPPRDEARYWPVLVELRYAECFDAAGGVLPGSASSVFTARPRPPAGVGFVTVTTKDGTVFVFDVGTTAAGANITSAADVRTGTALRRVGC